MKKRTNLLITLTLFISLISPVFIFGQVTADWIIEGNKVYLDDANIYLSAEPHTLNQDGWVEFELETVSFDGEIDIVWGFDTPDCTPHQPQLWQNYSHELTGWHIVDKTGNMIFYNVTGWINLGIENYSEYDVDYGNINNTYLYNVSYEANSSVIVAFTSYQEIGDGNDYRITGHYDKWESYIYYETFYDWKPWEAEFEAIDYEYGGMNKWWLLENTTIVHGHRYKVKAWIDVPFNSIGKYWWALKPHDRTISEAIATETFYCLDPWWNATYNFRRLITINNTFIDCNLDNFPVLVVLNTTIGSKCDSGNSIRFIDWTDNTTEYYYEIEDWNSSVNSFIWVNVTSISSTTDTKFWLYYNNSGASDNQNANNVWDTDYFLVWHMNDSTTSSITDSTGNANTGTKKGANEPNEGWGKIAHAQIFDDNDDYITVGTTATFNFMHQSSPNWTSEAWMTTATDTDQHFWFDNSKDSTSSKGVMAKKRDATHDMEFAIWRGVDGTWVCLDESACFDAGPSYYTIQFDYSLGAIAYRLARNLLVKATDAIDNTPSALDASYVMTIGARADDHLKTWDGYIDEFRISSVKRSNCWINASYHSQNQTTGFLAIGAEILGNQAPVQSGEIPADTSTEISINPQLKINISDSDYDTIWIEIYSNATGSWERLNVTNTNRSCDFNGDGKVNFTSDLIDYYGATGPPGWIPQDMDNDGDVDVNDLSLFTAAMGEQGWYDLLFIEDSNDDGIFGGIDVEVFNASLGWQVNGSYGLWGNLSKLPFGVYNTTYWWSVNATDNNTWTNATYKFTTERYYCIISSEYPADTETGVTMSINFSCNVTTNIDPTNATLNISFWTNASGNWYRFYWEGSGSIGNHTTNNTGNFSTGGTKYWWSVNVTSVGIDGAEWNNQTMTFTTAYIHADFTISAIDYENRTYEFTWSGLTSGAMYIYWDFGDGKANFDNKKTIIHKYLDEGPYNINLSVELKANEDIKDWIVKSVTCNPVEPEASEITTFFIDMDWDFLLWAVYILLFIGVINLLVKEALYLFKNKN